MRVGMGYDVHKLVENRKLILGGVEIPYEYGLLGHSDADVLVHAIMDALLGAAALRDIGRHFPDNDPAYEGADSIERRGSGQYQGNDRGRTWLYRKERGNFRTGDLLHFQGTRPDAGRPDRRRMQRLPGMRKERRRIKEKCDCTRPEDVVDWKKNKGVVGGIRDAIRPTTEEKAFLLALYEMTRLICINKYGADRSFSI